MNREWHDGGVMEPCPGLRMYLGSLVLLPLLAFDCAPADSLHIEYGDGSAIVRFCGRKFTIDNAVVAPTVRHERHGAAGDVWLVDFSAGDSCPSQYRVFQRTPEGLCRDLGEIGNCNEIGKIVPGRESLAIYFPEFMDAGRRAQTVVITKDGTNTY